MKKPEHEIWGVIPARGGSKSIPLKNMVGLNGHPLIEYVIEAAKTSGLINRIICSTEDARIKSFCLGKDIDVHDRPPELATDDSNVLDTLVFLLEQYQKDNGILPFAVALLQPTSPFMLSAQIDACVAALIENESANSSQTVTEFPHNFHAFNQRAIEAGNVRFRFPEERKKHYNKQTKPNFFILDAISSIVITFASQAMSTVCAARFTETTETPARPETTFSIREEQDAQCMPLTANCFCKKVRLKIFLSSKNKKYHDKTCYIIKLLLFVSNVRLENCMLSS